MKVSIIIPAWNLWEMTRDCLESLARHTPAELAEVIVADNGSTDATASELQSFGENLFGKNFKAARLEKNFGFSAGCNAGARAGSGDLLFFLNNDTLVTENWLPPLINALESPAIGMVSPLLVFPESNRVQHCGVVFEPTLAVRHLYSNFPAKHPVVRKKRRFQALSGAAIMLSAGLFEDCGGFNEGYMNGFEDLDLSCAVRKRNMHLVCEPESVIVHLTSQTPGRNDHDEQNARLLNQRHAGACLPDFHLKVMEDGFIPLLSPSLDIYCALPREKEEALNRAFASSFEASRCARRLEGEPFWQGGYEMLARHFETKDDWPGAMETRKMQSFFFPLAENAMALAKTALKAGNRAEADSAMAACEAFMADARNERMVDRARAMADWGKKAGDKVIEKLYADWSEEYFRKI